MATLLLSAGDASGEQHVADFVRAFRQRQPDARFIGMGGEQMAAAGVELVVDQRDLAVGGLVELAGSARRIVSAWRRMDRALRDSAPDLVVLTDSSGFNLPFAKRVRRRTRAPILYYVSPQVWAWRRGRIRKLARRVDRLAVILPFERAVYAGTGLDVEFVGHPIVDRLAGSMGQIDREQARASLGLAPTGGSIVTLMPGSRRNEIKQHLPIQLAAATRLAQGEPDVSFLLALAPSIEPESLTPYLEAAGVSSLRIVAGRTLEAIRASDAVLVKPGTGTVEIALLERPMVVMGRANPLTAAILRRAVHAPFFAMPNLIAGEKIVPELLQENAQPEAIASELARLLRGPARERQLAQLAEVGRRLGAGGAAVRTAAIAEAMMADEAQGPGDGHQASE